MYSPCAFFFGGGGGKKFILFLKSYRWIFAVKDQITSRHVYSPDICSSLAVCTVTHHALEHTLLTVSSPVVKTECIFCQSLKFIILPSNWYSSLQGGQRQHGMVSMYDTFAHDQQWELSPQTFSFKSASALHI